MRLLPPEFNRLSSPSIEDDRQNFASSGGLSDRFKFAVNVHGCDKNWDFDILSRRYEDRTGSLDDVIAHIKQGHALCAGLLNGKQRQKTNFAGSSWVLVDIDNSGLLKDEDGSVVKDENGKGIKIYEHQMDLEEAIADSFIRERCSVIYTTASHTAEWHRFRLIFRLSESVTDIELYESIVRLLLERIPHDPACKDGVRVFYGNTSAEFPLINRKACLSDEWIGIAAERLKETKRLRKQQQQIAEQKRRHFERRAKSEGRDDRKLALDALSFIPPRAIGSGGYQESFRVLAALKVIFGESEAESIAESWSPSQPGTTWNIAKKLKSFKRPDGVGAGTLFKIARQYGFKFPERTEELAGEPDQQEYELHCAKESERQQVEEVQEETRRFDRLVKWLDRLKGKGFGKTKTPAIAVETAQTYGQKLNSEIYGKAQVRAYRRGILDGYSGGKITYKNEQELREIILTVRSQGGRKEVLDTSVPGVGKSHTHGKVTSQTEGRTWWFSNTHANPTTAPVEDRFADMPSRNGGMVEDETRQTPSGKNFRHHPKAGQEPKDKGNCHLARLFNLAREKNFDADSTAKQNPICAMCQFGKGGETNPTSCQNAKGDGFGYRSERRTTLAHSEKIRLHPNQAPPPGTGDGQHKYDGDIRVLDEATGMLEVQKVAEVDLGDFDTTFAELERKLPEIHKQLEPMRSQLRLMVSGEESQHYGFNDAEIRERLPEPPKLGEVIEAIKAEVECDLSEVLDGGDRADTQALSAEIQKVKNKIKARYGKQAKLSNTIRTLERHEAVCEEAAAGVLKTTKQFFGGYTAGDARKALRTLSQSRTALLEIKAEIQDLEAELEGLEAARTAAQNSRRYVEQQLRKTAAKKLFNLPVQWLVPFLSVWGGCESGVLRVSKYGGLIVATEAPKLNKILDQPGVNIYLDATATPERIAFLRHIHPSEIVWIERETPPLENLKFIHIKGFGLAGASRTESCTTRLNKLKEALHEKHPGLVVFDWKQSLKTPSVIILENEPIAGHWFSDHTRGTNEYRNREAILAIGLPMPNLGHYQDLHLLHKQIYFKQAQSYLELEGFPPHEARTEARVLTHQLCPDFDGFYKEIVDAEIIQAVGRLRAVRRPDEDLTFYLAGDSDSSKVCDYEPPSCLNPQVVQASEICLEAGRSTEQAWAAVAEVVKHWWSANGAIPNQKQVAEATGLSQGWISKLANLFIGGWKEFKKVIYSLINPPRGGDDPPLTEPEAFVAAELTTIAQLPSLEVAMYLVEAIRDLGWTSWLRIVRQIPYSTRLGWVAALFRDKGNWEAVTA